MIDIYVEGVLVKLPVKRWKKNKKIRSGEGLDESGQRRSTCMGLKRYKNPRKVEKGHLYESTKNSFPYRGTEVNEPGFKSGQCNGY